MRLMVFLVKLAELSDNTSRVDRLAGWVDSKNIANVAVPAAARASAGRHLAVFARPVPVNAIHPFSMRLVSNPPNPFAHHTLEWDGPEPPAELQLFEEHAKSILS